jgi:hypothetical protein
VGEIALITSLIFRVILMRYFNLTVCFLSFWMASASTAVGQNESFPPAGGDFSPYSGPPPAYDNSFPDSGGPPSYGDSLPAQYEIGNAPGDLGPVPPYRPGPRNTSFQSGRPTNYPPQGPYTRPERTASYPPQGQYTRPTQEFGVPDNDRWGPHPDIYSLAPEGTRRPARPPRAEPAPPLDANPANEVGSAVAQEQPQNEFFEPNPADLKDDAIWYQPTTWEDFGWDATVEFGLNGSAGNSRTNALKAGFKAERDSEVYKFLFEIVHNRASAEDISTQDNVISKLRGDRKLGKSRWSLFAQGYGEYDEFKDFDLRLAGTMGITYQFIKTDTTTLSSDFGSGVSHEIGGPDDSYTPEAMLGLNFKHKLSKRQQLYIKSEYFPDYGNFHSYRVVSDAGWELLLDEEWGLNLKIGVIDRYDSTPDSRRPNDFNYSMLLLWKL